MFQLCASFWLLHLNVEGAILRQRFANVEQVALKGVDESVPRQILSEQVKEVVSRKARAVVFNDEFDVVIVSDTLVEDPDDEQAALGKPTSKEQAVAMLLTFTWSPSSCMVRNHGAFYGQLAFKCRTRSC